MQRKELTNAIKKFSNKTNFYKLGLVRKYLKKQEQIQCELLGAIPKVVCPKCGSHRIEVHHSDGEYSFESWLYCNDCEEDFDDEFGLEDSLNELNYESWSDSILIDLYCEEPDIRTEEWKQFCETEIKKYLGIIKPEAIMF